MDKQQFLASMSTRGLDEHDLARVTDLYETCKFVDNLADLRKPGEKHEALYDTNLADMSCLSASECLKESTWITKTFTKYYPQDFLQEGYEHLIGPIEPLQPTLIILRHMTRSEIETKHPELVGYEWIKVEARFHHDKIRVAECLIDADYLADYYSWVLNRSDERVKRFKLELRLTFGLVDTPNEDWKRNIYEGTLFDYKAGDPKADEIVYFYKSSSGASAIDLVLKKKYIIQPGGHLHIDLPLNKAYQWRQPCFGLRSSIARQGISISHYFELDNGLFRILIVNYSKALVALGNRFMWIMPEANVSRGKNASLGRW